MKKIRILKQILTVLLIVSMFLFINEGVAKASLQSNPSTQYTKIMDSMEWERSFREMETAGETMGLTEILNEDLTATSESNGIDVHMIRTTEYGATAILSTSGYGNSSNNNKIITTTGNDTGVILNTDYWEGTAGGNFGWIFKGVNKKYYDEYTEPNSVKIGDALGNSKANSPGCAMWHGATMADWSSPLSNYFARGYTGIFSFCIGATRDNRYSRGVVVCGEGI